MHACIYVYANICRFSTFLSYIYVFLILLFFSGDDFRFFKRSLKIDEENYPLRGIASRSTAQMYILFSIC